MNLHWSELFVIGPHNVTASAHSSSVTLMPECVWVCAAVIGEVPLHKPAVYNMPPKRSHANMNEAGSCEGELSGVWLKASRGPGQRHWQVR